MKKKNRSSGKPPADVPGAPGGIRSRAEKLLQEKGVYENSMGEPDLRALVHELKVHQIELEMQNEELFRSKGELEESRQKFRDLYDFAPVGYASLDADGTIWDMNLAGASLLGEARINLVKKRFQMVLPPESIPVFNEFSARVMTSALRQTLELRIRNLGEFPRYIQIEGRAMEEDTMKHRLFRAAFFDITDRINAEQALREKEEKLTRSVIEKEALLAEIHHRVKNNLTALISLLSLEGTYEDTPEGKRLKKDLQNRARSMALIHDTLYKTRMYSGVNMDVYLKTLAGQIACSFERVRLVHLIVNAGGIDLDLARATPCGMIVNELITNSFKYAFPDSFACESGQQDSCTIGVFLTKDEKEYTLKVSDNGAGLPAGFEPKAAQSLGLKLVNFLAKHQLRATIDVTTNPGTMFSIRFPIDPKITLERS
jgi:PAS domain S-box-containing protein